MAMPHSVYVYIFHTALHVLTVLQCASGRLCPMLLPSIEQALRPIKYNESFDVLHYQGIAGDDVDVDADVDRSRNQIIT